MKQSLKFFSVLLLVPAIVLFFISPDSPTHYFYDRCDSANFFMCGKAWMCGMIPYVDFTDSKGPLLWLIYGLGYLISPRSYVGVLFLSIFAYTVTYFFTYRIALVVLEKHAPSLLATLLMTPFFFCPLYHYETRAEDFCLPFVMAALYKTCSVLYEDNNQYSYFREASLVLGFSMGATLLIKFTTTAMLGVFVPFILMEAFFKRHSVLQSIGWMLIGALFVVTPFVIVFLIEGNITDFIDQYFLVTFRTVKELQATEEQGLGQYVLRIMQSVPSLLFFVFSAAMPLFFPVVRRYSFFPIIAVLFFILVSTLNAKWSYYYSICSCFMIFGCIAIAQMTYSTFRQYWTRNTVIAAVVCVTLTIFSNYHYYYYSVDSAKKQNLKIQKDNLTRQAYQYYSDVLSQWGPHPRIIYADTQCQSEYGVAAEALPGCRDWSQQNGATAAMRTATWDAIARHETDFVVAANDTSCQRLERLGYTRVDKSDIQAKNTLYYYIHP